MEPEAQAKPEHMVPTSTSMPSVPLQEHDASTATGVVTQHQKNKAARRLLQEWLADESGYDEEVWPKVKQIIEANRLSPRKRFCD